MATIILADYDVDLLTGFLPNIDPLTALPDYFAPWDAIGTQLPALLLTGQLRAYVEKMPLLDPNQLQGKAEIERAMLLLSTIGNAYVWAEAENPAKVMPHNLAVPLWQVTERLGRKPIVSHAANVLQNWRRIDASKPIDLDNLVLLLPFLSSSDESWFVLVTVAIEARGAPMLSLLAQAKNIAVAPFTDANAKILETRLNTIAGGIESMSHTLMRMYEKCDPYIFFNRVRAFLAGWPAPGLIYEGVSDTPHMFAGGSAGQSSLIQAFDAALGVQHTSEHSKHFFIEMRAYMPPPHRNFIAALEQGPGVCDYVEQHQSQHPALLAAFNNCIELLTDFRKKHMEIAIRYITMQAPKNVEAKGTGGTSFAQMLGVVKQQTREGLLP